MVCILVGGIQAKMLMARPKEPDMPPNSAKKSGYIGVSDLKSQTKGKISD